MFPKPVVYHSYRVGTQKAEICPYLSPYVYQSHRVPIQSHCIPVQSNCVPIQSHCVPVQSCTVPCVVQLLTQSPTLILNPNPNPGTQRDWYSIGLGHRDPTPCCSHYSANEDRSCSSSRDQIGCLYVCVSLLPDFSQCSLDGSACTLFPALVAHYYRTYCLATHRFGCCTLTAGTVGICFVVIAC